MWQACGWSCCPQVLWAVGFWQGAGLPPLLSTHLAQEATLLLTQQLFTERAGLVTLTLCILTAAHQYNGHTLRSFLGCCEGTLCGTQGCQLGRA